jgi:hypothetical protein
MTLKEANKDVASIVSHKPIHFDHLKKNTALSKIKAVEEYKQSGKREEFLQ